ncbi:MAG: MFS transporter, partial [Planctomycetes bacterium]|nr:MFS transporter [Planctomycetota bacterium]
DPARGDRERFDVWGTALLAATLAAAALAMTSGRRAAGGQLAMLVSLAVVGAAVFVAVERRAAAPLVPLGMLRDAVLGPALLTNAAVSAVLMATLVVGPFHLTRALGLTASQAGLVMAVGPVVSAITGVPAGRLVDRVGPRRMARVGLLGVAVGAALLAASGATTLGYLLPLAVMTSSYALFQAANNTAVMTDVAAARRGVVSGLLSLSRNLGLMTGAALLGAVFAAACGAADVADAAPDAVAAAMRVTFGVAALVVAGAGGVGARWAARAARGGRA